VDTGTAVVLGALIGGFTGLAGTLVAGFLQRRAAERAQRQAWRADVYVRALTALNRERMIIARTFPIIGPGQAPPPPPTDEVAELVQATLSAHSSSAMRVLLDRWMEVGSRFNACAWELAEGDQSAKTEHISFREATGGRTRSDVWRDLDGARRELIGKPPIQSILSAIEAQVRQELGHTD